MSTFFKNLKPLTAAASLSAAIAVAITVPGLVSATDHSQNKPTQSYNLPINIDQVRQTPAGDKFVGWLDPVLSMVATAAVESNNRSSTLGNTPYLASDSAFYLQVNFAQMRESSAGSELYDWIDDEILEEISDEFGDELGQEFAENLDGISIFGVGEQQDPVVLIHGLLSQSMHDHLRDGLLDELDNPNIQSQNGLEYFVLEDLDIDLDFLDLDADEGETIYYSIGNIGPGQSIITTSEDVLEEYLDNGGELNNTLSDELIVIQANRPLLQGGLNTRHNAFSDGPWQSKFVKNVEQFGLVIADQGDNFDIRLQAITKTPSMASALADLAEGLISLKTLTYDEDDELSQFIDSLSISHDNNIASFSIQIPANDLVDILD